MKTARPLHAAATRLEALFPAAMAALFRSEESDPLYGLSVGQIRLLRALHSGEKSSADLCALLRLSPSSLAQITQRLMRAGLVEKRSCPRDRRGRRFALASHGLALMGARQAKRVQKASRLLAQLPSDQVDLLVALLARIAEEQAPSDPSETPE